MTDQPKWTPAPWALEIRAGSGTAADCTIAMIEQADERAPYRGMIARLQSAEHIEGIAKDEMVANARLIAAAPNMAGVSPRAAEMLRVAATFLRSEEPNGTVFYDGAACDAFCIADDCEAAADDIDAALAKARGQA